MTDHEEIQQMIADCEAREEKLSDWESKFIDSVSNQDYALTEKQVRILEEIWEKVT